MLRNSEAQPKFTLSYKKKLSVLIRNVISRYCTPDGISILSCVGNCDLTFHTDFIFGNYSYNENLSGKVGVGVGVSGAGNKVNGSFSASVGWHHVNEMTESGANLFTMSEVIIHFVFYILFY